MSTNVPVANLPWWQDRATVTTLTGAVLAIALGLVDAGFVHLLDRQTDVLLVGGGIGALLGHNPLGSRLAA